MDVFLCSVSRLFARSPMSSWTLLSELLPFCSLTHFPFSCTFFYNCSHPRIHMHNHTRSNRHLPDRQFRALFSAELLHFFVSLPSFLVLLLLLVSLSHVRVQISTHTATFLLPDLCSGLFLLLDLLLLLLSLSHYTHTHTHLQHTYKRSNRGRCRLAGLTPPPRWAACCGCSAVTTATARTSTTSIA